MRIVAEHPDLRRQYEQIVASQQRFGFFSQAWVQDCLHPNWCYVVNENQEILLRIPLSKKYGLKAYLQPLFMRSLDYLGEEQTSLKQELYHFLSKQNLLHLNLAEMAAPSTKSSIGKYQLLALGPDLITIRNNYSDNIKRSIKKASQLSLKAINYADFHAFFIAQKGENLGSLNAAAWQRLEKLYLEAQEKNMAFCYGAFNQDQLLAVGLFFHWNTQLYFMKGTINMEGKKQGALVFLIDGLIQKWHSTCQTLDFIGSNQESIATFYKKFGALDRDYLVVKGKFPIV